MIISMDAINGFITTNAPVFGVIAFLGAMFAYWRTGGFNMQRTIIESFRTRVDQLEKDVVRLTALDNEKTKEIGKLQGIISEKDGYINLLKEVSLDRNPEMKEFVSAMKTFMTKNETRDTKILGILDKIEQHFREEHPIGK